MQLAKKKKTLYVRMPDITLLDSSLSWLAVPMFTCPQTEQITIVLQGPV